MKYLLLALFCFLGLSMQGEVFTFQTDGDWDEPSNWDNYPGTTTNASDEVIIDADVNIDLSLTINGDITILAGKSCDVNWSIDVFGVFKNSGIVTNNSQIIVRSITENFGEWINNGPIISIQNTIINSTGSFVNNGSITVYNDSEVNIFGDFENAENGTFTVVADLNIKNSGSDLFVNNGHFAINGLAIIEGKIINAADKSFYIHSSGHATFSDDSVLENNGIFHVRGLSHMSSQMVSASDLGYTKLNKWGAIIVKPSIPSVL